MPFNVEGMKWLVKEEPEHYNFDQFVADGSTVWSGVKNPLAQKNLRSMKKGDKVFYYHTGKEKAIVGTAKVASEPRPDPNDPAGRQFVVELEPDQETAASRDARRDQSGGEVRATSHWSVCHACRSCR